MAIPARMIAPLVLALLAAGCEALPPGNVLETPAGHDLGDFTLRVVDQSSLVVSIRSERFDPPIARDAEARAFPERRELEVGWLGGACHFRPTLTVAGTAEALHLTLEPDAGPGLPFFASCPAVGIFFGLTLTLSVPVDQAAITLEVN